MEKDLAFCKCGEICVTGGPEKPLYKARDEKNIIHIDDEGNEILQSESKSLETIEPETRPNRIELIKMLDNMIKSIEVLPSNAMISPVSHYDYCSLLILLSALFKSEDDATRA